jgi:hypothetical protein
MKKTVLYPVVIFVLTLNAVPVDGQVLEVRETIQEHSMWCWDASSVCILNYYGFVFTQCEIANWAFSRSDCCEGPDFPWRDPASTTDPPPDTPAIAETISPEAAPMMSMTFSFNTEALQPP